MKKIIVIALSLVFILNGGIFASGSELPGKNDTRIKNTAFSARSFKSLSNSPQSYPGKGIFLNVAPGYSRIYNKDHYEDEFMESIGGLGFNFDAGYFIRFRRYIGIGFGIGLSRYQTECSSDYFTTTLNVTDIDGDSVNQNIEVNNLVQKTSLLYGDIPVFVEIGNPNTHQISFYVRLGAKFSFPLTYTFTSTGETTINGYYPEYYVLLHDIPELGYESNKSVVVTNDTELQNFSISMMVTAGVSIPISDYFILKVGANLNYGLTEISDEKLPEGDVSYYLGNCNSLLMSPQGKTTIQSAGLEIGIIYILDSKL